MNKLTLPTGYSVSQYIWYEIKKKCILDKRKLRNRAWTFCAPPPSPLHCIFLQTCSLPLTNISFFKMVWANTTRGKYGLPTMHKIHSVSVFWNFDKQNYKKNCSCILSQCNIVSFCLNINKQLNGNLLVYKPVFTIHVKCLSNYLYKYSITYI